MAVERLTRKQFDDVVRVLCGAFRDYPVMRYVVGDAADYDAGLTRLVAHFTEMRFARDYPVLGIAASSGELMAAANLNPPRGVSPTPSIEQSYRSLREAIGDAGIARFEAFAEACEPLEPAERHVYVGMIGVLPGQQGSGYARQLLDAIHAISAADEDSKGVCLTTETEHNVRLYEHFGYRVLGKAATADGELETWTLFRDDR